MPLRTFVATIPILVAFAQRIDAQLVVRVESHGAAVYGAEVAAWNQSGRLASARTDGAGIVRLRVDQGATPVAFITARRLGFAPARLSWPAADSVTIELSQSAAELPALAVTSRRLRCPATGEDDAERLWTLAASRYAPGQDSTPYGFLGAWEQERVSAGERGFGDPPTQRRLGGSASLAVDFRSRARGMLYGSYDHHRPAFGAEYDQWRYLPLHGRVAWHFASRDFLERHTLVVLGHTSSSTILGFCPRAREGPSIEGELEIGSDTLFRGARWSFHVPHDDEDAGGEATFGTGRLDGATYLVAIRGSFWRRVGRNAYEQERFVLDAWRFGRTFDDAWLRSWNARGDRSGVPTPELAAPRP